MIKKKIRYKLIGISILIVFLLWFMNILAVNRQLRKTNARAINNIEQLGTTNSILKMNIKEINNYISALDTEHKILVDSILSAHKIKLKSLKKFQHIETRYINMDTISSDMSEPIPINDSVYRMDIFNSRECINIYGYTLSRDTSTKVVINKVEGSNNVYIIRSYRKSFWDKLFFRKGKEVNHITSDCGEVFNNEIIIE